MNNKGTLLMFVTVLSLLAASSSRSAIFVAEEMWTNGNGVANWHISNEINGTASGGLSDGALGNPSPDLRVDVTTGVPPPPAADLVYADSSSSGGAFAGNVNYTLVSGQPRSTFISFDFYQYAGAPTAPSQVGLFFTSGSTPGALWVADLPLSTSAGWTGYQVSMTDNPSVWFDINVSGALFSNSIVDVDQIGVRINYVSSATQTYGLDNFRRGYSTAVPEPGMFAALGFAFASMGLTFRRRLNDAVAKIKGMFKK